MVAQELYFCVNSKYFWQFLTVSVMLFYRSSQVVIATLNDSVDIFCNYHLMKHINGHNIRIKINLTLKHLPSYIIVKKYSTYSFYSRYFPQWISLWNSFIIIVFYTLKKHFTLSYSLVYIVNFNVFVYFLFIEKW